MPGRIVIVAYRPKAGKENALKQLAKEHYNRLKAQDLVSDRAPVLMQASDGTIVEVFEWKSEEAIKQAHLNPEVQKMWDEYNEVCEYIPIARIDEAFNLFSEFTPVD